MPTHAEQRLVHYTPAQMFDLVADIERYPEFLPWCTAVRVRSRDGQVVRADMEIGFNVFRERFTSQVTFARPHRIDVAYADGPFKYLANHWEFVPNPKGCLIDFFVDFEFRSRLMQKVIGLVFNEAVRLMVGAFERRAGTLYAPVAAAAPFKGAN